MNAFMGLNRNVFMSELTKQMGWIFESAQSAALNCYDNHKTWHLIAIFNFGSLLELIHPYVFRVLRDAKNQTHLLWSQGKIQITDTCLKW